MYELIIFAVSVAAALLTYEINVAKNKGPVKASAVVGLLFGLPVYFAPVFGVVVSASIPAAAIGASFAGMSDAKAIPSRYWMFLTGTIFSGIFLFSNPVFAGNGGGLGISACVSVIITLGVMKGVSFVKWRIGK